MMLKLRESMATLYYLTWSRAALTAAVGTKIGNNAMSFAHGLPLCMEGLGSADLSQSA